MRARTLLRIAAVFTAIQAVGHTFGGVLGPIQPGNQMTAAMAMKVNQFDAMGSVRTFWDFFIGFGLCISVFLLLEAGLLWIVAKTIDDRVTEWRPILQLLLMCNIALGVLGMRFFFPATLVPPAIDVVCIGGVLLKRNHAAQLSALDN